MTADLAIDVLRVPVEAILDLREHYRREMRCQIVHDSWHARGFTHSYHALLDGQIVGYGSVGGAPGEPKTTIKEFFVVPSARWAAEALFWRLIVTSGALTVESQTNDASLSPLLHDCARDLASHTILFNEGVTTNHTAPGILRRVTEANRETVFRHEREPVGDWGLEYDGRLVATGGLLYHYNPPYGDLYMEVSAPYRLKGSAAISCRN